MYVIGDIGNTETKICVCSTHKKILKKIILKSSLISNSYLKKNLSSIFKKNVVIKRIVFSSVVPKIFKLIKIFVLKNFRLKVFEVKELNVNKLINISVNRKQIGSDRLCNAIGINLIKNPEIKNYPTTNIFKETGFKVKKYDLIRNIEKNYISNLKLFA